MGNRPTTNDGSSTAAMQAIEIAKQRQRARLESKSGRFGPDGKAEAMALLEWWLEMYYDGNVPENVIRRTIARYLMEEYLWYLEGVDIATQLDCQERPRRAFEDSWGDTCQKLFHRPNADGYQRHAILAREIRIYNAPNSTAADQVHIWYLRYWLKTTPEGMLQEMYAAGLVGALLGVMGIVSSVSNRVPATNPSPAPANSNRPRQGGNQGSRQGASQNANQVLARQTSIRRRLNLQRMAAAANSNVGHSRWIYKAQLGRSFPKSGVPQNHFTHFLNVADDTAHIIGLRVVKQAATRWITKGYPGKPLSVKAKADPESGIVTAQSASEIGEARNAGYFVVDNDFVPRNATGQRLDLPAQTEWPLQRGQVIDGRLRKPLVSDYDLLLVAPADSPGQNISLHSVGGNSVPNRTNPRVQRIINRLNRGFDRERVLHGPHDMALDLWDEPVVIFLPGRRALFLPDGEAATGFYHFIRRATSQGSYGGGRVRVNAQ